MAPAVRQKRHIFNICTDAVAALLRGNREVLRDFTGEETGLLVALLTRLIANLDRVASVEASPGTSISEKGD